MTRDEEVMKLLLQRCNSNFINSTTLDSVLMNFWRNDSSNAKTHLESLIRRGYINNEVKGMFEINISEDEFAF